VAASGDSDGGAAMLSDDALFEGFVTAALPPAAFHHEQHVRVAWMFVRRYGMPSALAEFTAAIRRFAETNGARDLYHETITWAFLLIIAERIDSDPAGSWPGFAAANPDLLVWKPSILGRYYSSDLLASARARRVFVMPDRLQGGD
jgi:hypothetical protein